MAAEWTDTLLRASLRRVETWWSEHHLLSLGITTVIELVISIGFFGFVGTAEGLASLVLVPLAMFLLLVAHTHLQMVRQARIAIGGLLNAPNPLHARLADESIRNFRCEVVANPPEERVLLRVRNQDATGEFSAKVMTVDGVDTNGTWPITSRWLADSDASSLAIARGDSEIIELVRVRGKRTVDFLQPTSSRSSYQRVKVAENGVDPLVMAHLRVFNRRDGIEGHLSCDIEVDLTDEKKPTARIVDDVTRPS